MNQVQQHSLFTDFDIDLFKAGKHFRLYEKLGAHLIEVNGVKGVYFAVWAPSARSVSVLGSLVFCLLECCFNYLFYSIHKSYSHDCSGNPFFNCLGFKPKAIEKRLERKA